jgi:hypothetical protein
MREPLSFAFIISNSLCVIALILSDALLARGFFGNFLGLNFINVNLLIITW